MFAIDIILGLCAASVAVYCKIITKKLNNFTNLESGIGNAIAVLSAQVDELKAALEHANFAASKSKTELQSLLERAQISENNLEIMIAALQDIPHQSSEQDDAESIPLKRHRIRKSYLRAAE